MLILCHSTCMAKKKLYTQEEMRAELRAKLRGRKQMDVAAEIGVTPARLSQVSTGFPINGPILAWLGYEKAEALYRRVAR